MKTIKYGEDAYRKLLSGVEKTAKICGETMGPVASNVIISQNGVQRVTKDGITVIRSLEFEDKFEDAASRMIREASAKTNSEAGDGTTGTCVLLAEIFKKGLRYTALGGNKIKIRNGILAAAKSAVAYLEDNSRQISNADEIRHVAKISANQSEEIADVLSNVFSKIGLKGVIKVEEGNAVETYSRIVDGCQHDSGYLSPYFSTNEKLEADMADPYVLITDKKISTAQELLPLLQAVYNTQRQLLIICDGMEGEALHTVILNKIKGFPVCVVSAPGYGDNRTEILEDLAVLTGGKVVSENTGLTIAQATPQSGILGQAKRVIATSETTTIIGGAGGKDDIAERVAKIDAQIAACSDTWLKGKYEERRAKLDGGIAIVSVGGKTQSELKEKRDLVDDAFNAVKAALKKGVVPGGGTALLRAKAYLESAASAVDDEDERIGMKILIDSLDAPIRKILTNAGQPAEIVINGVLSEKDFWRGWDVLKNGYVDTFEDGLLDPAAVVIAEIENASSIAGLMLTTSAAVIDVPEKPACHCGN